MSLRHADALRHTVTKTYEDMLRHTATVKAHIMASKPPKPLQKGMTHSPMV